MRHQKTSIPWQLIPLLLVIVLALGGTLAPARAGATTRGTVIVEGIERTYELTVPDAVAAAEPESVPLLIALHPFASSGKAWRALSGFDAVAEERGVIVAYPDAADMDWNDGSQTAGGWQGLDVGDDIAFMEALIDQLSADYPVDPARVYLAGFAAGGTFAYRAACEIPGRFDRIAVSGALMWDFLADLCVAPAPDDASAPPVDPASLLVLLGAEDGDYPVEGRLSETPNGMLQAFSFEHTLAFWAERNACDPDAVTVDDTTGAVLYPDCGDDTTVAGHVIAGMGHNWPRQGDYTLNQFGFDMAALLADYFLGDAPTLAQIAPDVDTALLHEDQPRTYSLYVPPGYDPSEPMPLVIALHGRPGTATGLAYIMDSNWVAAEEGFMLLYPDGLPVLIENYDGIGREWNYGRAIPGYQDPDHPELYQTDDVAFLQTLVDDLSRDLNIDRDRVYVTGFSNGGFMVERIACEAGEAFAAYVVAGATMVPELIESYCTGAPPVPIMYMHGTEDPSIPWQGVQARGQILTYSAPDSALYWATHNRCDPEATELDVIPMADPDAATEVYHYTFGGCAEGTGVSFYVIEGGGHNLPGVQRLDPAIAQNVNMDIHVGETWWAFLSQYARDAGAD